MSARCRLVVSTSTTARAGASRAGRNQTTKAIHLDRLWRSRCVRKTSVRAWAMSPIPADEKKPMLSHCANPRCSIPFLRLREGKLFLVQIEISCQSREAETPSFRRARPKRRVERYWLCDPCATEWTLIYDREQKVLLVPARPSFASVSVAAKGAFSEVVLSQES